MDNTMKPKSMGNAEIVLTSIEKLLEELRGRTNDEEGVLENVKYRGAIEGIANVAHNLGLMTTSERDLCIELANNIPMATSKSLIPTAMKATAKRIIEESQGIFLLESTNPLRTQMSIATHASKVGAQIDMAVTLGLVDKKDIDAWINEVRSIYQGDTTQWNPQDGSQKSLIN